MRQPSLTDRLCADAKFLARVAEGAGRAELAREFCPVYGCSEMPIRDALKRLESEPAAPVTQTPEPATATDLWEQRGDTATLEKRGLTREIRSLEDLVSACDINLAEWEVERYVCNAWGMGAKDSSGQLQTQTLYQVKAWLKRNHAARKASAVVDAILQRARQQAPSYPPLPAPRRGHSGVMAEVSLPDAHLGKLCWSAETGGPDYDLRIARDTVRQVVEAILAGIMPHQPERITLVLGHDYLNTDNLQGHTTAGTPQDGDSRYFKVYQTALELSIETIERCAALAPVRVVMVPGNHDHVSILTLGAALGCQFRNTGGRVVINDSPRKIKYEHWGKCLLGLTHGDKRKLETLPLQMAQDVPDLWAASTHREIHCGHYHHERQREVMGVNVRCLSALCATDAYHSDHGYSHARRRAEAFLWDREAGCVGTVIHTVKELS